MSNWQERTALLIGDEAVARLNAARVIVFGVGGVGGHLVEALARCGVGSLTLVDSDRVSETNINRQIIATRSTVGMYKTEAFRERIADINPDCKVECRSVFYSEENADEFDLSSYDYVVDCIDTLPPKVNLIAAALERGLPVVSSMGAGAKTDPTKMDICDIAKTHHCPLAHMLRKRLHKIGIRTGFQAVFSPEPVREGAMILCEEQNKKSNTGTISYIPALFGIGCASVVIRGLIGEM